MAGMPGRSGGHNRLPIEILKRRGTYRPSRHGALTSAPPDAVPPLSEADRRRTLRNLPPAARRVASDLLEAYQGWDASSLEVLRNYAQSCARLSTLHQAEPDLRAIYREMRCNLALLKALDLESR